MLLITLAIALQTADYFPLKAGLTWEYEIVIEGTVVTAKEKMKTLAPVKIGNDDAIPLQVLIDGKVDNTAYYRVQNGYVTLVADESKEPYDKPVPVLPTDAKVGAKWEFLGTSRVLGSTTGMKVKSKITKSEEVEVLGKKQNALRVEIDGEMGKGATVLTTKTTEMYVAGIGLVYRRQEYKSKQSGTVITRLIGFEGSY